MAIIIDVNKDVTQRLKFEPSKAHGMFCIGRLDNVEFGEVESKPTAEWEFKGLTVPRIAFHFTNKKFDASEPDRFFSHSELPVPIVKKDGSASKYVINLTELWNRLKHIHNAFIGCPNYRPINPGDIPAFTDDLTSNPSVRLEEFKKFFTFMQKNFVGDPTKGEKPMWLDAQGNSIDLTMKLIATDGDKAQYLALPTFVGTGFIQPFRLKGTALDTTLSFKGSETAVCQAMTISPAPGAPGSAEGMENYPDDIKAALLRKASGQ